MRNTFQSSVLSSKWLPNFKVTLLGTDADDFFWGYSRPYTYFGGGGIDTVDYSKSSEAVTVNLTTGIGAGGLAEGDGYILIENIFGSRFADLFMGDASDNTFWGLQGDDSFRATAGSDIFYGGAGFDDVSYLDLARGIRVDLTKSTDQVTKGKDAFDTLDSIELITGTQHSDVFIGSEWDDRFSGAEGDDLFFASAGADTYDGAVGRDTLDYSGYGTGVRIDLAEGQVAKPSLTQNGVTVYDSFESIEEFIGSRHNDVFRGGGQDITVYGLEGDDFIQIAGGNNTYWGGAGFDEFRVSGPNDGGHTIHGGLTYDRFVAETDNSALNITEDGASSIGGTIDGFRYTGMESFRLLGDGNTALGGAGRQTVTIAGSNNRVDLGDGNDFVAVALAAGSQSLGANTVLDGADGYDQLNFFEAVTGGPSDGLVIDLRTGEAYARTAPEDRVSFSNFEQISGSRADDTFFDSLNNDTMIGNQGRDTFVFNHDEEGQSDTILYFEIGQDKINLDNTSIRSWRDLNEGRDDDYMEQVGNDAVIHTTDTDTITLVGIDIADLTRDEFVF